MEGGGGFDSGVDQSFWTFSSVREFVLELEFDSGAGTLFGPYYHTSHLASSE
jgi:hypothetical protein